MAEYKTKLPMRGRWQGWNDIWSTSSKDIIREKKKTEIRKILRCNGGRSSVHKNSQWKRATGLQVRRQHQIIVATDRRGKRDLGIIIESDGESKYAA